MHLPPNRAALVLALLLAFLKFLTPSALAASGAAATSGTAASANPPVFLSGTITGPYPDYTEQNLSSIPIGKTLVVPVVISGSGPLTYSATSSSPYLLPIVKTGYPVMNIEVTYSGTTATSGSVSTLYAFTTGSDGGNPQAPLIQASNSLLYGTTLADGTSGFGTVFQITTTGGFSTLYTFTGHDDGANPYAPLYQSPAGNFYGTTQNGGANSAGIVYQVTLSGTLTPLYAFTGGADGGNPQAGVITAGTSGNLYGTTTKGGSGGGTVFQLTTTGTLATLHSFTGGADGGNPQGSLISALDGKFYGATAGGGITGFGTVYQLTTSGSLSTLYRFSGGSDGAHPYGGVIQATDGNLYGTTESGGTGSGTIFRISTSGSFATLYTFTGGSDGANPYGGLIQATDGAFYGTTETGGAGKGTIFRITPAGVFSTLYIFTGAADGANPYAGLIEGADSNFYGTTESSGTGNGGTVFQLPATISPAFSGTMSFALFRDMAPTTTGYIAGFAQGGYYNGLQFFRITNLASNSFGDAAFIAQGGDPSNTGTGNPGFAFDNELNPSLIFSGAGQLAMANSDSASSPTFHGTNGTQFFITDGYGAASHDAGMRSLDLNYTIFGQLLRGFDTMQKIMAVTTGTNGETPTAPVIMDSVTVTEDNTDAVLLVSSIGPAAKATIKVAAADPSGTKAVVPSLTGTTSTPDLSISVSTFDDIVDDPPIVLPHANVFAPLHQKVTIPITSRDLEFDYLMPGAVLLSGSSGTVSLFRNIATVTPKAASPIGGDSVGLYVYEPFTSGNTEHATAVDVGLGTGKLTAVPTLFTTTPGVALNSSTYGSFLTSNPHASATEFTASINWGDGSALSGTGAVSVVKSPYLPTTYSLSSTSSHSYSNPGIYPINIAVSDTNGAVLNFQNTAVVSSSNIYGFGRTFTAPKGVFNGLVATFVDYTTAMTAFEFQASINWGDGSVSNGIIRGGNGNYRIYGKHKYTAGATYPVDVAITSSANPAHSGYAWSIARLATVPTHQPPFPQSHIIGELGNPGFGSGYLDEEVTLFNSGNIHSGPITLKFYLSPTSTTQPISSAAIPLQIGKGSVYNAQSIPGNSAISGAVSDIIVPSTVSSRGKYLIMQVITSDPIGSHMDYPRAFADPNPLID